MTEDDGAGFDALFAATGLDPALYDMAEFRDAHRRLVALLERLDDPERPADAQALGLFDPTRPL